MERFQHIEVEQAVLIYAIALCGVDKANASFGIYGPKRASVGCDNAETGLSRQDVCLPQHQLRAEGRELRHNNNNNNNVSQINR